MKKILISIIAIMFFVPIKVNALAITNTRVEGTNEATIGGEFGLSFHVSYDEVKKGTDNTYGVWLVAYEIEFDDSVFMISSVKSNIWDTIIYKEDGKYYVLSEIGEANPDKNKCVDNILYCSEYYVVVNFFVKDTTVTSSTIKMGEVDVEVFPVDGGMNPEYDEDDSISLTAVSNKSQTINIKKSTGNVVEEPKNIVQNSKPEISEPKASDNTKVTADNLKSSNAYLKDLTIKGYAIDFYKRTNEYDLMVEKGTNNLEIEAKLADEKSTLEIIGADDLKAHNYKVEINVTAENGDKNTYIINIKEEKEEQIKKLSTLTLVAKVKKAIIKYKVYLIIGASVILLIATIATIISKINDKKLGNKFDEF